MTEKSQKFLPCENTGNIYDSCLRHDSSYEPNFNLVWKYFTARGLVRYEHFSISNVSNYYFFLHCRQDFIFKT